MFTKIAARVIFAAVVLCNLALGQTRDVVTRVLADPKVKTALEHIDRDHDRMVREIIQITEVEAPSFKESNRAAMYLDMLRRHGLADVEMDAEGNVMGVRKGAGTSPLIALAAHLDTVFPEGTNVKVKRNGTTLQAPGIGDNSRSLAVLLAIIRAMDAAQIRTSSDILFVGNVGEEGLGDLRGMRYLFLKGRYKDRIKTFISIDGAGSGNDIAVGALGSRRYRATFKGPGGHSYGAFGLVNPAYALANAVKKISMLKVPDNPRTTFNVGLIGGGTSVNSIPFESWMEVDLRSESPAELDKVTQAFVRLVQSAVDEENMTRSTAQGKIQLDLKLVGDRPSGQTPINSTLVQTATTVIRSFDMEPHMSISSTDANLPISLSIPAITIDSGGEGGRAHALDEWINIERASSVKGTNMAMVLVLSVAGVQ